MHSKVKGNIGEAAVIFDLFKRGFSVFREIGDLSKTDLIVLIDTKPYKIQVKNNVYAPNNGSITLSLNKSGPNYKFKYTKEDVDLFALYISEIDKVVYISWKDLEGSSNINIRYKETLNKQKTGINWYEKYTDIRRAITN